MSAKKKSISTSICFVLWMLVQFCATTQKTCSMTRNENELYCFGILPHFDGKLAHIVNMVIDLNNRSDCTNFTKLNENFPNLERLVLRNGNISNCKFLPPNITNYNLKTLGLVNLNLAEIDEYFFHTFQLLETINVVKNDLVTLDGLQFPKKLKNLYIEENPWDCSKNLVWVLDLKDVIRDLNRTKCSKIAHKDRPLNAIAKYSAEVQNNCPTPCKCVLKKCVLNFDNAWEPIIAVNCSNFGLRELPKFLPNGTRILHAQHNSITDLVPIRENHYFDSVVDLFLDDNKITNLVSLEGDSWLRRFRILSLKRNCLFYISTYTLDRVLGQNYHIPHALQLYLSENPWRCDCSFTPIFQEFLRKYMSYIPDVHQIKCSYHNDEINTMTPIIEINRKSLCKFESMHIYGIQPFDLLNVFLALLIALMIGKLAYDYYHFKKSGRLPWIVTKLP